MVFPSVTRDGIVHEKADSPKVTDLGKVTARMQSYNGPLRRRERRAAEAGVRKADIQRETVLINGNDVQ